MVRGKLTVIIGGVRSGKSAYAEKMLIEKAGGTNHRLVYIASGQKSDPEMAARIEKHRQDRAEFHWITIEQPVKLYEILPFIKENDFVLWDCVTTWLANELYEGWEENRPCLEVNGCMEEKFERLSETIDTLLQTVSQLVIVSNEVLDESLSASKEVQNYSRRIGKIHQHLVEKADSAIEMDYGLPIYWKKQSGGMAK